MHPNVPNPCHASIGGNHAEHGEELGCASHQLDRLGERDPVMAIAPPSA
jgi:hypothetical protein